MLKLFDHLKPAIELCCGSASLWLTPGQGPAHPDLGQDQLHKKSLGAEVTLPARIGDLSCVAFLSSPAPFPSLSPLLIGFSLISQPMLL